MSRRANLLLQEDQVAKSKPRRPRDPARPNLPFDPMPDRIEPCLAKLRSTAPAGDDWAFEVKWDGDRFAAHIEPKGVRLSTRGGHHWTARFPEMLKQRGNSGAQSRRHNMSMYRDAMVVLAEMEIEPRKSAVLLEAAGGLSSSLWCRRRKDLRIIREGGSAVMAMVC
jgi:hypothetical protein